MNTWLTGFAILLSTYNFATCFPVKDDHSSVKVQTLNEDRELGENLFTHASEDTGLDTDQVKAFHQVKHVKGSMKNEKAAMETISKNIKRHSLDVLSTIRNTLRNDPYGEGLWEKERYKHGAPKNSIDGKNPDSKLSDRNTRDFATATGLISLKNSYSEPKVKSGSKKESVQVKTKKEPVRVIDGMNADNLAKEIQKLLAAKEENQQVATKMAMAGKENLLFGVKTMPEHSSKNKKKSSISAEKVVKSQITLEDEAQKETHKENVDAGRQTGKSRDESLLAQNTLFGIKEVENIQKKSIHNPWPSLKSRDESVHAQNRLFGIKEVEKVQKKGTGMHNPWPAFNSHDGSLHVQNRLFGIEEAHNVQTKSIHSPWPSFKKEQYVLDHPWPRPTFKKEHNVMDQPWPTLRKAYLPNLASSKAKQDTSKKFHTAKNTGGYESVMKTGGLHANNMGQRKAPFRDMHAPFGTTASGLLHVKDEILKKELKMDDKSVTQEARNGPGYSAMGNDVGSKVVFHGIPIKRGVEEKADNRWFDWDDHFPQ